MQGFKRSLSLENFKTIYLFLNSVHHAKKIISEFKPDVVLGTGGYVSGAVLYAAAKKHIPTVFPYRFFDIFYKFFKTVKLFGAV